MQPSQEEGQADDSSPGMPSSGFNDSGSDSPGLHSSEDVNVEGDSSECEEETEDAVSSESEDDGAVADSSECEEESEKADSSQSEDDGAVADSSESEDDAAEADSSESEDDRAQAASSESEDDRAEAASSESEDDRAEADSSECEGKTEEIDSSQSEDDRAEASSSESEDSDLNNPKPVLQTAHDRIVDTCNSGVYNSQVWLLLTSYLCVCQHWFQLHAVLLRFAPLIDTIMFYKHKFPEKCGTLPCSNRSDTIQS